MPKHTIKTIQVLRGLAASLVVFYHGQHYLSVRGYIPTVEPIYDFGRSGVDIFFVISGFIMVYIAWENFQKPGASKDFLIRRVIRIVPIYWFYSAVIALLLLYLPQYFSRGKEFDLGNVLASFLFIPKANSIGEMNPVLPVGWTLNYEMYFYLLFSVVLLTRRQRFIVPLAIFLLGGVVVGMLSKPGEAVFSVMTSPLLLEFMMGCLIGAWYRSGRNVPTWLSVALIASSLSLFVSGVLIDHSAVSRVIVWGVPAALLVTGLVFLEKNTSLRAPRFLVSMGGSSYSLYLSHMFSVHLIGIIWMKFIGTHLYLYTFVAFAFAVAVGFASLILLERPATAMFSALYKKRQSKALMAAG